MHYNIRSMSYRIIFVLILILSIRMAYPQNIYKTFCKQILAYEKEFEKSHGGDDIVDTPIILELPDSLIIPILEVSDTIYWIETFDYQNHLYNGRIWSTANELEYEFDGNDFYYPTTSVFTKYTRTLIEDWNLEEIKKEERINSNLIPCPLICGTRITIVNQELNIERIVFKTFFDIERDSY